MSDICGSPNETYKEKCPVCKEVGQKVKKITVENIVKEEHKDSITEDNYFLCVTPECDVVYFNQAGNSIFRKNDVKVPVWFKEKESPKPICYCNNVSDTTILKHVVEMGYTALAEIQKYTGAGKGGECLTKNPAGR